VARNRPVALLAAWKATPGRIICIERQHEESFLSRTPTEALSEVGFSEEMAQRLSLFGYEDIESLKDLTKRHLTVQFGDEGSQLFDFLHPDVEKVSFYSPPPTVGLSKDFERDVREPGPLRKALEEMAEVLQERLCGKACQRLSVRLTGRQGEQEESRLLREPIGKKAPIYRAASTLFKRALTADITVQTIDLEAKGLRSVSGMQGHLFRKRPALQRAISTIQEKHAGALYQVDRNEGAVFEEDRYTYEPVAAGS
jgi:nucleotidyltransferase/DNA polymerase involved in DNA repair